MTSTVIGAARPIHPAERDDFLRGLAAELQRQTVIGPGLVHRLCADLQRGFTVEARSQAAIAGEARHLEPPKPAG